MSDKQSTKHKECKEYNSLKYKTMIMTGQNLETKIDNEKSIDELNSYLIKEMNENKKQSWNKLTRTEKIKKLTYYVENTLTTKHNLNQHEIQTTQSYILTLLDRKRLSKNSEIDYNEENGLIQHIPIIIFNETKRNFTLNRVFKVSAKKKQIPKSKTVKKVKEEQNK